MNILLFRNIFLVFLALSLISCSSSSDTDIQYDEDGNPIVQLNVEDENQDSQDVSTETQPDSSDVPTLVELQEEEPDDEHVVQSQTSNQKEILKSYGLSSKIFQIFEKYTLPLVPLNKHTDIGVSIFVDEDGNVISESSDERLQPIIISTFSIKDDLNQFIDKYFSNYTVIATARFSNKTKISAKDIQSYGAYIDSKLIILKAYYAESNGLYLYDIIFLDGDTSQNSNYWYRTIDESIPLENTLEKLNISDINSYDNVLPPIIPNQEDESTDTSDTNSESSEDSTPSEELENQTDENVDQVDENTSNEPSPAPLKQEDTDYLRGISEYDVQKLLIEYRVINVVGLWKNLITDEVYEIRELPQGDLAPPNKKYAGYIVLEDELQNLTINSSITWFPGDLVFEFNILTADGFFVNHEKMLNDSQIRGYQAKGMIMIFQSNGTIQYLIPVLDHEINTTLYDDLYKYIADKNTPKKGSLSSIDYLYIDVIDYKQNLDKFNTFFTGWLYPVVGLITIAVLTALGATAF